MAIDLKVQERNASGETITRESLTDRFRTVRAFTEELTKPLKNEDFVIQVVEHASPAKWHLAHTSWFFEAFFLEKALNKYQTKHPQYSYLFNSYYLQTGEPHCRNKRGNLSRPTVKEVFEYRKYVNDYVLKFLDNCSESEFEEWASVLEIGLNHEQQHQELLLTDLKYMFGQNPLRPVYTDNRRPVAENRAELEWTSFNEGVYEIGHPGGSFGYDNEFPRHKTYIHDFKLANRLITNGEYLEFIKAGGYSDPKYWLDEGFALISEQDIKNPLYWEKRSDGWHQFTLNGLEKIREHDPVTHVNYYEADAFARWAGYRLPTEFEWELAAQNTELDGSFVDSRYYHPSPAKTGKEGLQQLFGEAWQWTRSSYAAYPGYETFPGALGEYNGKFMCNQYVLRGGSCATSKSHYRKTYRNFFHAKFGWQFTGIRLAQ